MSDTLNNLAETNIDDIDAEFSTDHSIDPPSETAKTVAVEPRYLTPLKSPNLSGSSSCKYVDDSATGYESTAGYGYSSYDELRIDEYVEYVEDKYDEPIEIPGIII